MSTFLLSFLCVFFAANASAEMVRVESEDAQRRIMVKLQESIVPKTPSHCFVRKSDDTSFHVNIFSDMFYSEQEGLAAQLAEETEFWESGRYGLGFVYRDDTNHQIGIAGDGTPWKSSGAKMTVQFDEKMERALKLSFELGHFANVELDCGIR